jgi:hypothetical protein
MSNVNQKYINTCTTPSHKTPNHNKVLSSGFCNEIEYLLRLISKAGPHDGAGLIFAFNL